MQEMSKSHSKRVRDMTGIIKDHKLLIPRDKPKGLRVGRRPAWLSRVMDGKSLAFLISLGLVVIISVYKIIDQAATISELQATIRVLSGNACNYNAVGSYERQELVVLREGSILDVNKLNASINVAGAGPPGASQTVVNTGEENKTSNMQVINPAAAVMQAPVDGLPQPPPLNPQPPGENAQPPGENAQPRGDNPQAPPTDTQLDQNSDDPPAPGAQAEADAFLQGLPLAAQQPADPADQNPAAADPPPQADLPAAVPDVLGPPPQNQTQNQTVPGQPSVAADTPAQNEGVPAPVVQAAVPLQDQSSVPQQDQVPAQSPVAPPLAPGECRQIPAPELQFAFPPLNITALATFPGSGNTWTRHLIQQLSGYNTGSVYDDLDLKFGGFPGEYRMDGSVIVVKTHLTGPEHRANLQFQKAIIIIRQPIDALVAEFNRRAKGHTGLADEARYNSEEWRSYLNQEMPNWLIFYKDWLTFEGPKLLLYYDEMRSDLKTALRALCEFLGINGKCTESKLQCVVQNSTGNFKRTSNGTNNRSHFTIEQITSLERDKDTLYKVVETCVKEGRCTRHGTLWPIGLI